METSGIEEWKERMVAFGSDGARVMVGERGGAVALLKEDVPHLVPIHCLAHRLELGAADTIKHTDDMKKITYMLVGKVIIRAL